MLQIICDACRAPIPETGFVCDLVETRLVYDSEGPPHMSERGSIRSLFICDTCRRRVEDALNVPSAVSPARRAG